MNRPGFNPGSSAQLPARPPSRRRAGVAPLRTATLVAALSGVMLLSACHPKEPAAPVPGPVVAVAVHPDGQPVASALPGEVEARYATPLSFRVAGKIIERRVRLGDTVKSGEVVARLDPADAQKNAASAQAALDAAQHRLVFARQQLDRDRAQLHDNLISQAQFEQTTDAYASAAAQRDQADQQAALARNQLQYTTLVSDHTGVITAEQADTGQNVSAGQSVYNLAWTGDVDVICDVPESALATLAVGQIAKVTLPALSGRSFTARVRELSPAADPQSRTFRARLTLENAGPDVRLGMTASVSLARDNAARGASSSFVVPATALFHEGNAPALWIVRADDTLELRRIQVTRYNERTIAVSEGLKDGERVVLQGVHTVAAGEKVRVIAPLHPEDFAS
ncbi:RND family efflux transporter MFP subunit [Paraburkholderia sp. BL10I2N1]|nr:RND family efflux transporter MFP subunit [Paraburkholderia sp. BL10I2N1]